MKNTELKWIKNTTAAFLVTATLFPSVLVIAQLSSVPVTNMLVCLGFAIALTAWFGKSPYQVNAPTISVGLVCMDCASRYGLQGLSIAVALGGLMQLLIGTFKLGRYFRAIPDATLKGLMAGIGIEIIIRQVPVLYAPIEKLWQGSTDGFSVAFGAGALVLAFGWNALLPSRVVKVLPGILLVVLVVAGLSVMFGQADQSILFGAYSNPLLSKGLIWNNEFLFYGFSIALISSLKSLITAVKMDDNNMTDMDYELKVSGVVNAICGLLAGLPVSGHIARSMLLKEVASDSKPSLLMQIVWFAAFSFASFKFAMHLPEVTLAAILIFCSVKLIDVKFFKEHIKYGKTDLILAFTTLLCVVIFNINFGLFAGFILGLFRVTATLSADLKIDVAKTEDGKKAQVKFKWRSHLFKSTGPVRVTQEGQRSGRSAYGHHSNLLFRQSMHIFFYRLAKAG